MVAYITLISLTGIGFALSILLSLTACLVISAIYVVGLWASWRAYNAGKRELNSGVNLALSLFSPILVGLWLSRAVYFLAEEPWLWEWALK